MENTYRPNNATYYSHPNLKPLYMLIKVEVDSEIVHNQDKAEAYAENHCNSLEYALCDWYYPDEPQYPYIAKCSGRYGSTHSAASQMTRHVTMTML